LDRAILNIPERITQVQALLKKKRSLRFLYEEIYGLYREVLQRCPQDGIALELGSGGGFVKDIIPEMITSDVIDHPSLDRKIDARVLPFHEASLRGVFMWNVFHHIPDAEKFLAEIERCLKPCGRLFMIEPYFGWLGSLIYQYGHTEPCDLHAKSWQFESTGPMTDANIALPWIIFFRDRKLFERKFPKLVIREIKYVIPLRYWLTGGMKSWNLLPSWIYGSAKKLDSALLRLNHKTASFMSIEVERIA
jgi:SAM-dependent methyltransferase